MRKNIDKVIFEGYTDEDEDRFQEIYKEWQENELHVPKGDVKEIIVKDEVEDKANILDEDIFGF